MAKRRSRAADAEGFDLGETQPSLEEILSRTAADLIAPRPEQAEEQTALCEKSLYEFGKAAWHTIEPATPFVDGWHIGCIAEHLQALTELQIQNLIINVPPRHMKSSLLVFWFCWTWTRMPQSQWIFTSYGENLAFRDANKCKDIINSAWYKARWGHIFRLRRGQQGAERFANDRQGYRIATTIAGKAMGEGGDFLAGDDVQKPADTRSKVMRQAVVDAWSKTISTRGNNPKTVRKCQVQQRLHESDLTGYLISERGGYEHLCYDRRTEVLTPSGWVRFDRLEEGIQVAQVDTKTLEMTFAVPSRYVRYRYEGPVRRYESVCLNLVVTPDHRMVYKDPNDFSSGDKKENWRVRSAKDLPKNFYIPQAIVWNAPDVQQVEFGGQTWDGDDFCRFMGAWLSEGCTRLYKAKRYKEGVYRDVVISQDVGLYHDWIAGLLLRIPFKLNRNPQGKKRPNHVHFKCYERQLWNALRPFGGSAEKYVPRVIKTMSARQIGIFLEWYGLGDGHRLKKNKAQTQYVSKSRRLIDDVQELMLRVGRCGGLQVYTDCFRIQNRVDKNGETKHYGLVAPRNSRIEPFADDVFCVSVPNGAIVVRRNGKTAVSGNCLPAEYEPQRYWFPDQAQEDARPPRDAIVPTKLQRERPELMDPRTEEGELLWPERFGPDEIQTLRQDLEAVGWAGQGQQRPAPATGSVFKLEHFRRCQAIRQHGEHLIVLQRGPNPEDEERIPVHDWRFFQVADTAMTVNAHSAWTALLTLAWHRRSRNLVVWSVWRQKLEIPYQLKAILAMRDGEAVIAKGQVILPGSLRPWPMPLVFQAVEKKSSGIGLIQESILVGKPLRGIGASRDKVARAATAATMYEAGRIWHRSNMPLLVDFEEELLSFPMGVFSDMVDCLVHSANLATEDALLNAAIDGDLCMDVPRNRDGSRASLDDLRAVIEGGEVYKIGPYRVAFPEDED